MRTWIAVHLPQLPLEALRPSWCSPGRHVVLEQERALTVSAQALADGVRPGMRRSGILGLCPQAVLHARSESAEAEALDSLALGLLQYTPELAFDQEHTLLLDVTASLRMFGGRLRLCRLVRATVAALGFTSRIGLAPTARGAWLLARCPLTRGTPQQRRVARLETLARRLDRMPCTVLPCARPFSAWLDGIGCRTLADLRRLPRAGLKRRCSADLLLALDRAYGEEDELFEWVQVPPSFAAKLELPERVEHAEAVLFAARRLLLQMTGWLVARQLAVTRFALALEHERGRQALAPTVLDIALAEAAWQEAHLTRLLKERLGRIQLAAPVIGLRLEAAQMEAMAPPTASLFPDPGGSPADYKRLLELLSARLGEESVLAPTPQADYRPDLCNRWTPATAARTAAKDEAPSLMRPFWLLEKPVELTMRDHRPFYQTPLRLVTPPERIECGWWDGQLLVRDYFIALGEDAGCYWIYRERRGEEIRWALHGLFA